jgi:copper(I)-binding protein
VYLTVEAYGEMDTLVSASTDVADSVELHETNMADDGTMSMQRAPGFDLPADGELVLEPGGKHIMLVGVDQLDVGATISVTLQFAGAGDLQVDVEVVEPAETMDHDMGDDG